MSTTAVSRLYGGGGDRRLRRRKLVNRAMDGVATLSALAAVAVLGIVTISVLSHGVSALSWDFFTKTPGGLFTGGGGLANAFVGSLVIVGVAALLAVPVAVLIAIFLTEFASPRIAAPIRFVLDVMNGLPAIVVGIFVFTLLVKAHGQSAFTASVAVAILMLPLVSRATQEILAAVPSSLREAGLAVGASRWRTVVGVILPTALGGILTGTTLAVARAAGETAPLLFTSSLLTTTGVSWSPQHALYSVPLAIFELSESPEPADHARAWAASFVLVAFILVASLAARAALARSHRKLGQMQ
jgi:phosphate transport system permease protein